MEPTLGSWVLTSTNFIKFRLKIPAEQLRSGTCAITFEISSPISPAQLGLSSDQRNLGMGVARMVFKV